MSNNKPETVKQYSLLTEIRKVNETRTWPAGKCLIFDDPIEHEAWNHGDRNRIILLLDFKPVQNLSERRSND